MQHRLEGVQPVEAKMKPSQLRATGVWSSNLQPQISAINTTRASSIRGDEGHCTHDPETDRSIIYDTTARECLNYCII